MKGALLILWRETVERRAVLAAALVAGLLAFASPLLPGVVAGQAAEARDAMAIAVAIGFGLLVALMVGASVVARDLADGRLAFDFAQPLGACAIGTGRFLAAILLFLASLGLALVPATLAGGGVLSSVSAHFAAFSWLVALGAVVVVPLAHVASVAIRSRSRWLVLDLAGAVTALGFATLAVQRVQAAGATHTGVTLVHALGAAGAPALWLASAVQVIRGRSDLRRGHRVQSLTLAPALAAIALAGYGFSVWLVAVGPADLVVATAEGAPQGNWAVLDGQARGRPSDYHPVFLVDVQRKEHLPLGLGLEVVFSGDGRRAAWFDLEDKRDTDFQIVTADLDATPPRVRTTPLVFRGRWPLPQMALSPSGTRIAIEEQDRVSAFETDSGHLLATERFSAGESWRTVAFRTDDRLRLYEKTAGTLQIDELDLVERRLVPIASVSARGALAWTRDHERLLLHGPGGQLLIDGSTGAILARRGPLRDHSARTRLLADGRLAILEGDADGASRLAIVTRDGGDERTLQLSQPLRTLGPEPEPGRLLAQGLPVDRPGSELAVIDLETGLVNNLGVSGWSGEKTAKLAYETPEPGSLASRLVNAFSGSTTAVGVYEPALGIVRPILAE